MIRAGLNNFAHQDKREEGGSTLTQQLVKNIVAGVGDKVTYERKIREMVIAAKIDNATHPLMSKDQILEMYMNFVYLGRGVSGVKLAAQMYFDKSLAQLSLAEMAFLAGMPKGPRFYNPDVNPQRSLDRTKYVLKEMNNNKFISDAEYDAAVVEATDMKRVPYVRPKSDNSGYFVNELIFSMRKQLNLDPRADRLTVDSTLHPQLQLDIVGALQDGLAQWEARNGRVVFSGPETNIAAKIQNGDFATALRSAELPLNDVHWNTGVILESGKKGTRVGLADGQSAPLKIPGKKAAPLKYGDVVYVSVGSSKGKVSADLRARPQVQGAVLVLENKTGRVVSMAGGFSHALSNLNRAVHMVRSPGSTVKPLTYLAALGSGLQPNTLVWDSPVAVEGANDQTFAPNSTDGAGSTELVTLRRGLEESRNRVTARLLNSFSSSPDRSLTQVLSLMEACGVADKMPHYWSTIIGTYEVPMINMATCFATLANGGYRPTPHFFENIYQDGAVLKPYVAKELVSAGIVDDASYYQLRTLMQGVVARGTAAGLNSTLADVVRAQGPRAQLSEFIGGKTGTSQNSNDAWFIGFTNDLTIAVWVGYDNASSKSRRNLGNNNSGASTAAPIFASVLRTTLADYPLRRLDSPRPSAAVQLFPRPVRVSDGTVLDFGASTADKGVAIDYFRLDRDGSAIDTHERLATGSSVDN